MRSTTGYRQGDIVLVSFPFTDLTSAKQRPAIVISPDAFNSRIEDVLLAAVTSQKARDEATVFVARHDVIEGALPQDSVVRLSKILTLHSSLVAKRLCRLTGTAVVISLTTAAALARLGNAPPGVRRHVVGFGGEIGSSGRESVTCHRWQKLPVTLRCPAARGQHLRSTFQTITNS